jgi:hypothetical protein
MQAMCTTLLNVFPIYVSFEQECRGCDSAICADLGIG